jgi:hypothetical protein
MAEPQKQNNLYDRLRSLFSTSVTVRTAAGKNGKQLKVVDTDRVRAVDRSKKLYTLGQGSVNYGNQQRQYNIQMRKQFFIEYEQMDKDGILSAALDIIADECVTKNEYGEVLQITSESEEIKEVLTNLFYDVLNVDYNLWLWVRSMAKYGDHFIELYVKEKMGIIGFDTLNVYNVERIEKEDDDGIMRTIFKDSSVSTQQTLQSFEVAHFKLLNDPNFFPYGRSFLEPARREWKRLNMMEDAMLVQRIMRAPERRVFKVDVGNIPPAEVDTYMQKLIAGMKKIPYQDPQTGEYNLRFNMENILEDFFIPVRGNSGGDDIETLPGLATFQIEDIEYLRDKMLASLKIPKTFLNYSEDMNGKASLAQSDIRFSRTVERIQLLAIDTLRKIAMVHLYSQGFDDSDLVNFELSLTLPSTLAEREKLDLISEKLRMVGEANATGLVSMAWLAEHVMQMTPEEFQLERDRLVLDKRFAAKLAKIEQEESAGDVSGLPTYPDDNSETSDTFGSEEEESTDVNPPRSEGDPTGADEIAGANRRDPNQQYKPNSTMKQREQFIKPRVASISSFLQEIEPKAHKRRLHEEK